VARLGEAVAAARAGETVPRSPSPLEGMTTSDAELDSFLATLAPRRQVRGREHALVTGATGFFGAFLLAELLDESDVHAHCLVRARDARHGWERLRETLASYGRWQPEHAERISVVVGDLEKPSLGLDSRAFDALCAEVDVIYHSGARVDALLPYEHLRAANVSGTRELLRISATASTKPFHFFSTLSAAVLDRPGASGASGYVVSKWHAEQLVIAARAKGLPASVFRLPRLSGDSRTGLGNRRDAAAQFLEWVLALRAAPEVDVEETWVPVDEAARVLVDAAREHRSGGLFRLTTEAPVRLRELVDVARKGGYDVELKPLAAWTSDLAARSPEAHEVLMSLFGDASSEQEARRPAESDSAGDFAPIIARGVDEGLIRVYLDALARQGRRADEAVAARPAP
jgi:thioester reductase-like protein